MERHLQLVDVRPEKRAEYLELHRAVWPGVLQRLRESHITNYSIFLIDDTLVAYYEYTGDDHAADLAAVAADPTTREWWALTDPCQRPFNGAEPPAEPGQLWRAAEEVWRLPE